MTEREDLVLDPDERERPTLKTIARLSGFSVPTVSRALSDAPDIGDDTKKRVQALAKELGYRPNRAGLRLRTGKTNVIALVLCTDHDVMNHTARLINSVAGALRGTPYHMIVTPYFPDESPLDPVKYIVRTRSADGVILNRVQPEDPRVAYLRECNFPFVLHGRTANLSGTPYFDFDNHAYGRLCIERLAERGRRHAVIVAPPLDQNYAQHMVAGVTEHAGDMSVAVLEGAHSDSQSGRITSVLGDYLGNHPETDAVITASAPSAIAAAIAIETLGRKIGADIDLTSKEAIPFLTAFRSEILVCYEDVAQTGQFLADALVRAIDAPHLPPMQKLIRPASIS